MPESVETNGESQARAIGRWIDDETEACAKIADEFAAKSNDLDEATARLIAFSIRRRIIVRNK